MPSRRLVKADVTILFKTWTAPEPAALSSPPAVSYALLLWALRFHQRIGKGPFDKLHHPSHDPKNVLRAYPAPSNETAR